MSSRLLTFRLFSLIEFKILSNVASKYIENVYGGFYKVVIRTEGQ